MKEWQIEAEVDYTFRSNGAAGPSYPSIIASGPNAATLHYISNDREMRTGELLLIDAGCEYDFYASDITRTFPIGARFTPLQRDLYEIVLGAQLKAIDAIKPGVNFDDPHEAACACWSTACADLGFVQGARWRRIRRRHVAPLLHASHQSLARHGRARCRTLSRRRRVAHARARDGSDRRARNLYRADDDEAPEEFRGIGIRIEDDVLVTETGHEVMTAATPKSVADVETLTTSG